METGEILAKSSAGNGQIRYGADVINRIIETTRSRVEYKKLQDAVIKETINPMIHANVQEHQPSGRPDLPDVRGIQHHHESSALQGSMQIYLRMEPYIPAFL